MRENFCKAIPTFTKPQGHGFRGGPKGEGGYDPSTELR